MYEFLCFEIKKFSRFFSKNEKYKKKIFLQNTTIHTPIDRFHRFMTKYDGNALLCHVTSRHVKSRHVSTNFHDFRQKIRNRNKK